MGSWLSKIDDALNRYDSPYFVPIHLLLSVVATISILSVVLESVQKFTPYMPFFLSIEWLTVGIFSAEYVARLMVSKNKLQHVLSFWCVLDAVSILPVLMLATHFVAMNVFCDLQIFRMLRILRFAKMLGLYFKTHERHRGRIDGAKINSVIYFMVLLFMIVTFAVLLYTVEHPHPGYENIPMAMIQSARVIVGGLAPEPAITLAGKLVLLLARLIGLILFGLLISIVGGFVTQFLFGSDEKK